MVRKGASNNKRRATDKSNDNCNDNDVVAGARNFEPAQAAFEPVFSTPLQQPPPHYAPLPPLPPKHNTTTPPYLYHTSNTYIDHQLSSGNKQQAPLQSANITEKPRSTLALLNDFLENAYKLQDR
jgi:hypothetical protein